MDTRVAKSLLQRFCVFLHMPYTSWGLVWGFCDAHFRGNVPQKVLELASVQLYTCKQCYIHVLEALIKCSISFDPFYIFTTVVIYM